MSKGIISGILLGLLFLEASTFVFNIQLTKVYGLAGDLNNDGVVDFEDLFIASLAFDSYPDHPRWNPQADLNDDKIIDGADLVLIAQHFGETAPPVIAATVEIHPQALNLRSNGRWITAYIELPEGYNSSDIDASTIMLNYTVPAESKPIATGDCDYDGIPDLMVKFEREKVIDLILGNCEFTDKFGIATLTITGELKEETFQGSDDIKIIR